MMDDLPLSRVAPGDPQRFLSDDARRRIQRARLKADRIRLEADAAIESKGFDTHGRRAAHLRNQANLKAAREVLTVFAKEFARIAPCLRIFHGWMREEVEAASNSLILHASQRQLLESGLSYPENGPPSLDPLAPLLEAASRRYSEYCDELCKERDGKYKAIAGMSLGGGCMGRAQKRFEVLEEFAAKRACKRVAIYRAVADEFGSNEMLSAIRLEDFRQLVRRDIQSECTAIRDVNERDCRAVGEVNPDALKSSERRLWVIQDRIFGAANNKIRVMEADRAARESTGKIAPIARPIAEAKHSIRAFPERAKWLKARLRERDWDHNDVPAFGGPDRKTTRWRILEGLRWTPSFGQNFVRS